MPTLKLEFLVAEGRISQFVDAFAVATSSLSVPIAIQDSGPAVPIPLFPQVQNLSVTDRTRKVMLALLRDLYDFFMDFL